MNINMRKLILLPFLLLLIACNAPAGNENTIVSIKTTLGDIKIQLYDSTPIHRDNFIKLVNSKVYDGIIFHRVIKEFMIQAGDPKTRKGLTREVTDTLDAYTLPAELTTNFHIVRLLDDAASLRPVLFQFENCLLVEVHLQSF
jgi:hypothetical protein